MATTTTNLIQGPADLYVGAFGATEPAETLATVQGAPSTGWTDVGGTMGGVTVSVTQEYAELKVDQIVDSPGRRLTKRDVTLKTSLAEPTAENLALTLNMLSSAVDTTITGLKKLSPTITTSATQPTYSAFILDGWAPNQKRRRIVVRKVLSTAGFESSYEKEGQTVFPVTLQAHYVSASIKPFVVLDEI